MHSPCFSKIAASHLLAPLKRGIRHVACSKGNGSSIRAEELRQAFQQFDRNKDGQISVEEVRSVLQSMGCPVSEENAREMIRGLDHNNDGFVDFKEFMEYHGPSCSKDEKEKELRGVFEVFDKDHDGFISENELHLLLTNLGEPCTLLECRWMIRGADINGDGMVDFNEFKRMLRNTTLWS